MRQAQSLWEARPEVRNRSCSVVYGPVSRALCAIFLHCLRRTFPEWSDRCYVAEGAGRQKTDGDTRTLNRRSANSSDPNGGETSGHDLYRRASRPRMASSWNIVQGFGGARESRRDCQASCWAKRAILQNIFPRRFRRIAMVKPGIAIGNTLGP